MGHTSGVDHFEIREIILDLERNNVSFSDVPLLLDFELNLKQMEDFQAILYQLETTFEDYSFAICLELAKAMRKNEMKLEGIGHLLVKHSASIYFFRKGSEFWNSPSTSGFLYREIRIDGLSQNISCYYSSYKMRSSYNRCFWVTGRQLLNRRTTSV